MSDRVDQEFTRALFEALQSLLGAYSVRQILDNSVLNGRLAVNPSGKLVFGPQAVYDDSRALTGVLLLQFTKVFGSEFSERTLETIYRRFQERYNNDRQILNAIFHLVPEGSLESVRIKRLSREELERIQIDLIEVNKRLQELDASKSQFVSVAAHQLRTPLTGIKWTLSALLEERIGKLNKDQKKFANDAYDSTLRLIRLVNDLLDAARLEEGRAGFKMEKQPFEPLAREVCQSFQKAAREKGIALSIQPFKERIPTLLFDKEKMGIVLENLVDNAIKYTPPGGRITVSLKKEEDSVQATVADTGIGMPEEQRSRVFSKFFRAENAQLAQTSGTGLGLYLAKNIVEHHGGSIGFETHENKGTTFTVSLPIPKTR